MEVECCFRVVDNVNEGNARKNYGCTKRGDCIEILPVGSDWGTEWSSGNATFWRIVKLDIPVSMQDALLAGESGSFPGRDARPRIYSLDLESMPSPFAQQIIDNVTTVTDLSRININALIHRKGDA